MPFHPPRWKTENPEDFDFIAGPRFDYTEIDTLGRNFDEEREEGSSSGRLLTQCTSFPRSPFLLSLPPIATVYGPGRGTVRSPSPYAKRELFIRGRWQFLFFSSFSFPSRFFFFLDTDPRVYSCHTAAYLCTDLP